MPKDFAPGIKFKDITGDHTELTAGQLFDYVLQKHTTLRSGGKTHYDFRIGNKNLGMHSWAIPHGLPTVPHDPRRAIRTSKHRHSYNEFEGNIPFPAYGAGNVKKEESGQVLITHVDPKKILFTKADKQQPERFNLIDTGKDWLISKSEHPIKPDVTKPEFKLLDPKKIEEHLSKFKGITTAKLDGASTILHLGKNSRPEMFSHRASSKTGLPIIVTEKVLGERPKLELPSELKGKSYLGEIYGMKGDKVIPSQEIAGLLNSSIGKSLTTQRDKGIKIRTMLFDIVDSKKPYSERLDEIQKDIKYLPKGFHAPNDIASTPKDAIALLQKILARTHPLTVEGVVMVGDDGKKLKGKVVKEHNAYIQGFTEAEKGSKYEGKAIGAIKYSHTPTGPIVGNIASGIDDSLRKMFYDKPEDFMGRKFSLTSLEILPSGAHRIPVFKTLEEAN